MSNPAVELQAVLHQVRRGRERHVGRERGQDEHVDVGRVAVGVRQAARGGLGAEVAGGLVRQGEPTLMDAQSG